MAHWIQVRIISRLPILVYGGITTWRIVLERYGKNGAKAELLAVCISHKDRESVCLVRGRSVVVEQAIGCGISAAEGTIAYRILGKLVKDGRAELVKP